MWRTRRLLVEKEEPSKVCYICQRGSFAIWPWKKQKLFMKCYHMPPQIVAKVCWRKFKQKAVNIYFFLPITFLKNPVYIWLWYIQNRPCKRLWKEILSIIKPKIKNQQTKQQWLHKLNQLLLNLMSILGVAFFLITASIYFQAEYVIKFFFIIFLLGVQEKLLPETKHIYLHLSVNIHPK